MPRKIIAEKYMTDSNNCDCLTDYKFYCFNGEADSVMVCVERDTGNPKFYFFDRNWKLKRYNKRGIEAPEDFTLPRPDNIDRMFEIADLLAGLSQTMFVRVDLYNSNGQILFGELTLFPNSGIDPNRLQETNLYFGEKTVISGQGE